MLRVAMPARAALPALALVACIVLAGCLGGPSGTTSGPAAPTTLLQRAAATVPAMDTDIRAGVAWWESFSTVYTKRDVFSPNSAAARDHIAASLRTQGFDVEALSFPAPAQGLPLPQVPPVEVHVVAAKRLGTEMPERAIAIGGHYDTQTATVQGAYDNGSGTAAVVSVCDALAKVETRRTILCLLFDGEEVGALGSIAYLDARADELAIDLYIGFDMVGANYPGKDVGDGTWKLFAWVGSEFEAQLHPFVNGTLHQVLGHPLSGVEAFPFNDRNSDEASFAERGIPTVRYAGGRTASAYPQYHMPGDTVEFVDSFVGGRSRFEAGFGAAVEAAYTQALMFDATSLDELAAEYAA